MKRNIRAVLFGVGTTGREVVRYLPKRGVDIVGVFGRRNHLGEDSGLVSGVEANGVVINSVAIDYVSKLLPKMKADIAIVCTTDDLETLELIFKV